MLSWLGHEGHIRVIAGGIQAWKDLGYPLTTGPESSTRPVSTFRLRLRPEINVETRELESKDRPFGLIDCRTNWEWMMGHIPGAVPYSFRRNSHRQGIQASGPGRTQKLLKSHGVDPEKPIVYYCTGGVRSGYAWMEHQLDGLSLARNYLGGIRRLGGQDERSAGLICVSLAYSIGKSYGFGGFRSVVGAFQAKVQFQQAV